MRGVLYESITDQVYEILRDEILQNRLAADNSKLSVQALAARLNVSRTPVQQAIYRLADAGLVVIRPRSGTYVSPVSLVEVQKTMDVRRALECLAVERAVAVFGAPMEARLDELATSIAELRGQENAQKAEESNYRFHLEIVMAAGNERLSRIYETLNLYLTMCRIHHRTDGWKLRIAQEKEEHMAIIAALRTGMVDSAKQAIEHHLMRSMDSLSRELSPHGSLSSNRSGL